MILKIPPACDYLVVESTYGNRLHDVERPKDALERIINEAAAHGSAVLIPAFAVGRAQEILYFIRELENEKRIPVLPVCLDSPMAAAATQAYARRTEEQDEDYALALKTNPTPLRTHSMLACSTRQDSKNINSMKGARIIVAASGMMNGGRILHHALRLLPDENAIVVFVGQAADAAVELPMAKSRWVLIMGVCVAEKDYGFSAHADWKSWRWLKV